jgi:hypothetical protein
MGPVEAVILGFAVLAAFVFVGLAIAGRRPLPDEGPPPPPRPPEGGPVGAAAPAADAPAPRPLPAREGDLVALGETTQKMVLDAGEMARGAAEPLPGLTTAYDRIARGEIHAHLQVIAGPVRGRAAALSHGGKVTVGRGRGNALDLKDSGVSIDQCVFESDGADVLVRDLSSKNGTFVNGDRVETRRLANCDIVACGASRILVTLDAGPVSLGD